MKRLVGAPLLLLTAAASEPAVSPAQVVEQQLIAYNAHDIDAFAATYAADAQIFKVPATIPALQGRPAIRARYAALFAAQPTIHVEVSGRLIAGNFISDHEEVRGTAAQAIIVYEVRDGLIQRAWLFSPPAQ